MYHFFSDIYAGVEFRSTTNPAVLYHINADGVVVGGRQYSSPVIVTLTGWNYSESDTLYYCQTLQNPNLYVKMERNVIEWERTASAVKKHSKEEAQRAVNKIIENNKYILNNNLFCARFANKLTADERKMLYSLQSRLENRNTQLKNSELLQNQEEGYPEGYSELAPELQSFMNNPNVGAIPVVAVIIVVAIVVASLSTAAYFAYRAYYIESESDVVYSKKLAEILQAKLSEEEYQQLLKETAGLLTKQRITQQIASLGGNIKNLLLVGLGLLLALRAPQWISAAQKAPVKQIKGK